MGAHIGVHIGVIKRIRLAGVGVEVGSATTFLGVAVGAAVGGVGVCVAGVGPSIVGLTFAPSGDSCPHPNRPAATAKPANTGTDRRIIR